MVVEGAGWMTKAPLVTPERVPAAAANASVYPPPAVSMARLLKEATPLTATRVVVPESVPVPRLELMLATTCVVISDVTVLPLRS